MATMSKFRIIKLKNLSPVHFGIGKNHYDFSSSVLHSDTISSALVSIRASRGKTEDVEQFLSSFTISSAFPFFKDSLYLPLPKGRLNVQIKGKKETEVRKRLKKLQYADLQIWSNIIEGACLEIEEEQISGSFLNSSSQSSTGSFLKKQLMERVCVTNNSNDGTVPFFFEWTFFHKEAGLYVIVDASDDVYKELLSLMRELGENGIGSDRSVGGGHFDVSEDFIEISVPENANTQLLLSLYIPSKEELVNLNLNSSHYSFLLRGGYMAGSSVSGFQRLRKKSVYMFDEGSVFPTMCNLKGTIVDLTPIWNDPKMHKVYRSGKPFTLPIIYR